MSRQNVETVRVAYDVAYAQRRVDDVREHFAEDFTWHTRAGFPRSQYGADEMPQLWADLDETYSDFSLVPLDYAEVGEYVLVTVKMSARMRGSDTRIEEKVWHVWDVRDGIAHKAWAYGDKREALAAVGLRE